MNPVLHTFVYSFSKGFFSPPRLARGTSCAYELLSTSDNFPKAFIVIGDAQINLAILGVEFKCAVVFSLHLPGKVTLCPLALTPDLVSSSFLCLGWAGAPSSPEAWPRAPGSGLAQGQLAGRFLSGGIQNAAGSSASVSGSMREVLPPENRGANSPPFRVAVDGWGPLGAGRLCGVNRLP